MTVDHASESARVHTGVAGPRAHRERIVAHLPLVTVLLDEIRADLPTGTDPEDLRSVGLLALVRAAVDHDPAAGPGFADVARIGIRTALAEAVRTVNAAPRPAGREPSSGVGRDVDCAAIPGPGSGDLQVAVDALPEPLRSVIDLYFRHGRSLAEVAAALGTTQERVLELRADGLRRLRGAITAATASPERPDRGPSDGTADRSARDRAIRAAEASRRTFFPMLGAGSPRQAMPTPDAGAIDLRGVC